MEQQQVSKTSADTKKETPLPEAESSNPPEKTAPATGAVVTNVEKMTLLDGGQATSSTAQLQQCEGDSSKSTSQGLGSEDDSSILDNALKRLDEVRDVIQLCQQKYPSFVSMERRIQALEEENKRLKLENNTLSKDKALAENALGRLKKKHEVTSTDLQCAYDLLTEAYNLNTAIQEQKKKDKHQIDNLSKSLKQAQDANLEHSRELSRLQKENKHLEDASNRDQERIGEVLAENQSILAESQTLLDLVAPEEEPRSVRERLKDAAAVAIQFFKSALKKSTADLLAVAKLHYPAIEYNVIGAGPPGTATEEEFNSLMEEADSTAAKLADEFELR